VKKSQGKNTDAQNTGFNEVIYRYSLLIKVPVLIAASFWGAILTILIMSDEQRLTMYIGAGFFVIFFMFFGSIYWLTEIRVCKEGLRYKGPLKRVNADWSDVLRIYVYEGAVYSWMLTEYQVITLKGYFSFTPFLVKHKKLVQQIREMSRTARKKVLQDDN